MSDWLKRIANLSLEKQERLYQAIQTGGEALNAFPVSFAQQRLWFLHQLDPTSPAYNSGNILRMKGALDIDMLKDSLRTIVKRHEILRTAFVSLGGQPIQVVQDEVEFSLPVTDITHLDDQRREATVQEISWEEVRRPFAIEQGALLRFKLIRIARHDHILLAAMHHIIADAWSLGVFARELSKLYEVFCRRQASPLAELTIQYGDFARWQRNWLQGPVLERLLKYWRSQLSGDLPVLQLPTDRPRAAAANRRGAIRAFDLSQGLVESLEELSRRSAATLFMTLLSAFNVLLHRYSGQTDIVTGSPIANRNAIELESLIGFFVNMLPLRVNLTGNPTFRALLERVRQVTLGAYAHQDLPFELLVDRLGYERGFSHSPLFQVVFALQNVPFAGFQLGDLAVSVSKVDSGTAKFDLTLNLTPAEKGLAGWLEYSSDLFDVDTITRMLDHFTRLLQGIASDPDRPLSELQLLSEAETRQVVFEWNDTRAEYPADSTIAELFQQRAEETPDSIAITCAESECSYAELNRMANQLAHLLISKGVKTDERVGCVVNRSLQAILVMLGILKAGAAYLPIDPQYPRRRIGYMLRQAGVRIIVTTGSFIVLDQPLQVVNLLADALQIALQPMSNPPPRSCPTSLAYVMFTSGSTGEPKGVEITQRGVLRLVLAADYVELGPAEVVLQLAPLTFDASTFEIWGALLNGGRVAVVEGCMATLQEIEQVLERAQVTTLWLTAGLFHLLVDERIGALRKVRQLLAGGDVISGRRAQRLMREAEGCQVINGYGPTESTTFACCHRVKELDGENVPIGKPISNTRARILGSNMELLPPGAVGGLYIGGDGLARGYLKSSDLTAERFVPDPFDGQGQRLYRTGDLAKYRAGGEIEFAGRSDEQVKVRGYRVEPGEVDAVMRAHESIETSVTIIRTRANAEKELATYAILKPGNAVTGIELQSYLSEHLPDYMIPPQIVFVERMPLTANGKVDRSALAALEPDTRLALCAMIPPRTPIEEELAGIWTGLLGVGKFGVHDDFFKLGGNSLLVVRLLSKVQWHFRVNVPLRDFYERPTVAKLAEFIEAGRRLNEDTLEKISSVLDKVKGLSPLEVEAMLTDRKRIDAKRNLK